MRKTPASKLARRETQANLLSLPIESAAVITSVSTRTVARDREVLQLKALANLSESTEQYWQSEMVLIRADIETVRQTALDMKGGRGADLLLRASDRWLKLVEMNIVKRSVTANVEIKGFYMTPWFNYLRLLSYGWDDATKEEFKLIANDFAEKRRPIEQPIVIGEFLNDD
jgi:hypothetical protein